jgi:hypothetical protein
MLTAAKRREVQSADGKCAQIFLAVWTVIHGIAVAGYILSCPVILGYQVFGWLQTGHFQSIALADWLLRNGLPQNDTWRWIAEPDSWYGLHKLVRFLLFDLPVWVWLMITFKLIAAWMENKANESLSPSKGATKG